MLLHHVFSWHADLKFVNVARRNYMLTTRNIAGFVKLLNNCQEAFVSVSMPVNELYWH